MATATSAAPLTASEIEALAVNWYQKLDVHAPVAELLPLVADTGLEMKFPEATLRSRDEFEAWYERVIRLFFDELHTLEQVWPKITPDGVEVKVVVHWEASVWTPPAANSQRIKLNAYQSWLVKRSIKTGKPWIVRYSVDKLDYTPDSACPAGARDAEVARVQARQTGL